MSLYEIYEAVIWWVTPVEIASALSRLQRMGQLDPRQWQTAQALASTLLEACTVIQPLDSLRTRATELVKLYDLRAADSLQLAAALEWCGHRPEGHVFLTADQKLRDAALLAGFDAKPL